MHHGAEYQGARGWIQDDGLGGYRSVGGSRRGSRGFFPDFPGVCNKKYQAIDSDDHTSLPR